jgi:hypothetical protein
VDECSAYGPEGIFPFDQQNYWNRGEYIVVTSEESQGFWEITTGRSDTSGCGFPQTIIAAEDDLELKYFGVRRLSGTATLNAVVFSDLDGNGMRGADEPLVPGSLVSLRPPDGSCILGDVSPDRIKAGAFFFSHLPAGEWFADAHVQYCCGPISGPTNTSPQPAKVRLKDGTTSEIEFGFHFPAFATIVVTVIDDSNGNGEPDADEEAVSGAIVCIDSGQFANPFTPNSSEPCQQTDTEGRVSFRNLEVGEYSAVVDPPARLESTWEIGPRSFVYVGDGDTAEITLIVRRPGSVGISSCATLSC